MIDHADLCILETMTDEMTPIERQCVEQVRELFDELEDARKQLEDAISPSALDEEKERADEAEKMLAAAENQRDDARDLAEERSREIDDLRNQLARAEAREDDATKKAAEYAMQLEKVLHIVQPALVLA
jgi:chromosome segregation ATPase